jgi:hypothetical protein
LTIADEFLERGNNAFALDEALFPPRNVEQPLIERIS